MIALLEQAFLEKGHGRVEMPPKPGIHTQPDAFIHAMPAFIPAMHAAGIKWVSGYPGNQALGLPYITGLLVLNDDVTGLPLAVMDCTWITAYRTGAATALSAKYLARPESAVAGILACGVQGRTNLEALAALFPLRRAYAYDVDKGRQAQYVAEMGPKLGIEVVGVDSPRAAVRRLLRAAAVLVPVQVRGAAARRVRHRSIRIGRGTWPAAAGPVAPKAAQSRWCRRPAPPAVRRPRAGLPAMPVRWRCPGSG